MEKRLSLLSVSVMATITNTFDLLVLTEMEVLNRPFVTLPTPMDPVSASD